MKYTLENNGINNKIYKNILFLIFKENNFKVNDVVPKAEYPTGL